MHSLGYLYICKRNNQPFWYDCGMTAQNPPKKRIDEKNHGLPPGEYFSAIAIKEIFVSEEFDKEKRTKMLKRFEDDFFDKISEFCERKNEWFRPSDASPERIVDILNNSFEGVMDIGEIDLNYHNRMVGNDRRLKQKHMDTLMDGAYVSFITGELMYPSKKCWGKNSCGKTLDLWKFYLDKDADQDHPNFDPKDQRNYRNKCMDCWSKETNLNKDLRKQTYVRGVLYD